MPPSIMATCEGCGLQFVAKSKAAKWCGTTCRQRATRAKAAGQAPPRKPAPARRRRVKSGFEKATEAELRRLGRLSSMLGQQALVLARRMGNDDEPGSALAALSREHSRLMDELGATVPPADDVTKARERRQSLLREAGLA